MQTACKTSKIQNSFQLQIMSKFLMAGKTIILEKFIILFKGWLLIENILMAIKIKQIAIIVYAYIIQL